MKNQGFIKDLSRKKAAAGNAFIIILIMVALLSALTMTLTRSNQNSTNLTQEQSKAIATQVLRQGRSMANAVESLQAKGCSITQFSFDNTIVTSTYVNAQSPSDKSCWLFDGAGAGMNFPIPPKSANDGSNWNFATNQSVFGVGPERETGLAPTTNSKDLLAVLPFVTLSVCQAINYLSGITTSISTAPPVATKMDLSRYYSASSTAADTLNFSLIPDGTGDFLGQSTAVPLTSSPIWDKKTACVYPSNYRITNAAGYVANTGSDYFFYQVLVER